MGMMVTVGRHLGYRGTSLAQSVEYMTSDLCLSPMLCERLLKNKILKQTNQQTNMTSCLSLILWGEAGASWPTQCMRQKTSFL